MKKAVSYLLLGIGGLALIYLSLVVYLMGGIGNFGMPVRWEIPPGYKGWIMLRSGDPSCKPYDKQGIWHVVHVANDGMACMSDSRETKWRFESFVYKNPDGSMTKIEYAEVTGGHRYDSPGGVIDAYFIGSGADAERTRPPYPKLLE